MTITIAGAGPLRLPMRAKTIVDAAVRNSLEVDTKEVELSSAVRDAIDAQLAVDSESIVTAKNARVWSVR